jgi:acyl-coenzyme A thioesterase PaaI-like protein
VEPVAVQDRYPDDFSHCHGCGRLNPRGLRVRSFPEGEETVCRFSPEPFHLSVPGFVYGGLLASLVDCHAMGTAAEAVRRLEGGPADGPALRFVTASLKVDFLRPTPAGVPLEIRARARETKPRKVIVEARVLAGGVETVRGEIVAVRMPDSMIARTAQPSDGPLT